MKDLVQIKVKDNDYICVDLRYNLGGFNGFSMKEEPRGYYLHVQPKTIEGNVEIMGAFTGYKRLILTVDRKSFKSSVRALKMVIEDNRKLLFNMITAVTIEGYPEKTTQSIFDEVLETLKRNTRTKKWIKIKYPGLQKKI